MSPATTPSSKTNPTHHRRNHRERSWSEWWSDVRLAVILFAVIGILFGGMTYLNYTEVNGSELNASNWELRDFTFRRDPFTNFQLTAIRYSAPRYSPGWIAKTDYLSIPEPVIQSYLTPKAASSPRWDLVRMYDRIEMSGRAKILVDLVGTNRLGTSQFWIDWTSNEPAKAKVLWPAAQKLVAADLYTKLPDLFELAVYEQDDANFAAAVAKLVDAAIP